MSDANMQYPPRKHAPFRDWSPSIHYAQYQQMPTGQLAPRRIYDFELLYVSQGEAATTIDGERHLLTAGQLVFLPSGVPHQNEALTVPYTKFLGIHFDFFDEIEVQKEADMVVGASGAGNRNFAEEAWCEAFPPLSQQLVYTPSLACVQLMDQLVQEFAQRPPGYELMCKSLMLQILTLLMRLPSSEDDCSVSRHRQKLLRLIEEIELEPALPWSNGSVAKRLDLSVDHAAKLFKGMTGLPPNAYVHALRHREARRLLRETELPIERIGELVGYSGIHYFSRLFKHHEGTSPSEYRKLSRVL